MKTITRGIYRGFLLIIFWSFSSVLISRPETTAQHASFETVTTQPIEESKTNAAGENDSRTASALAWFWPAAFLLGCIILSIVTLYVRILLNRAEIGDVVREVKSEESNKRKEFKMDENFRPVRR